jgi:hypothetical protein
LTAGTHEVQTQPGAPPGADIDIDSLVLDSAPGGAALATGPTGRAQPAQSGPAPAVTVLRSTATSAQVEVKDPKGPFWMVLGESTNAGWHATTGSGMDLGPPALIDGYANGWLVTPAKPGQNMVITLEWTPQRLVWVALVVSGVTIVACAVIGCWPRRRRRRRAQANPPGEVPATEAQVEGIVVVEVGADPVAAPLLSSPLRSSGTRPRWTVSVGAAILVGAATSAVISPEAGIPMALATFLALVIGYGRIFLALASVGLLVAVDKMVTSGQDTFHYLAEFGWPTHFETASTLAWFAVAALGADAVVQEVRDRRASRAGRDRDEHVHAPPTGAARSGPRRRRRPRGKHVRSV